MTVIPGQGRVVFAALALLSGCATDVGNMIGELENRHTGVELADVPFHSQITDQCGPAALASLLGTAGVAVSAEELKTRVYIPDRHGALQLELIAATRHFGRIPYEIDPNPSALVDELDAGRPVLVLQNLGVSIAPVWHYAVVIGYLPEKHQFVLRSGDKARLLVNARTFTRTWKRGSFWAIVALKPGELPSNADADRYLKSVVATDSAGTLENAILTYRGATQRWPGNSMAWLGLGNALYAEEKLPDAREAYRKMLEIKPGDAVAMNNLSQVYLELGCRDGALATINAALASVDDTDPVRAHLRVTQGEVLQSAAESRCL